GFLIKKEYGEQISNTLQSIVEAYTHDQTVYLKLALESEHSFEDFKVEVFDRCQWDASQNAAVYKAITNGELPNLMHRSPQSLSIDSIQAKTIKLQLPYGIYTLKLSLINVETEPILVQFEVPFSDLYVRLSQKLKGLPTFKELSKLLTHSPEWCDILAPKPLSLSVDLPSRSQVKYLSNASWISSPQKARLGSRVMVTNGKLSYKKYLNPFWLSREQVTNREYADFLLSLIQAMPSEQHTSIYECLMPRINLQMDQLKGQAAYLWDSAISNWRMNPVWLSLGSSFDSPLNWISANQLSLFMLWFSWRNRHPVCFPTNEQWEFACRGVDGRLFPWGDTTYKGFAQNGNLNNDSAPAALFKKTLQELLPTSEYQHPFLSPFPAGLTSLKQAQLFPRDQSPFDLRGLSGGLSDWTVKLGKFYDHIMQVNTSASRLDGSIHTLLDSSLWQREWQKCIQPELYSLDDVLMAARGGSHINSDSKSNAVYEFRAIYYRSYADIGVRLAYL
ncbi:MAG: hypothetical protein CL916_06140, partial [Deltaproteobacteria bacterium]|nr:hypothetical protein [Deltaproteobacteria bacterium]